MSCGESEPPKGFAYSQRTYVWQLFAGQATIIAGPTTAPPPDWISETVRMQVFRLQAPWTYPNIISVTSSRSKGWHLEQNRYDVGFCKIGYGMATLLDIISSRGQGAERLLPTEWYPDIRRAELACE